MRCQLVLLVVLTLLDSGFAARKLLDRVIKSQKMGDYTMAVTFYWDNEFASLIGGAPAVQPFVMPHLERVAALLNRLNHTQAGQGIEFRDIIPFHLVVTDIKQIDSVIEGAGKELTVTLFNFQEKVKSVKDQFHVFLTGRLVPVDNSGLKKHVTAASSGSGCGGAGVVRYDVLRHFHNDTVIDFNFGIDIAWVLMEILGTPDDNCRTGCQSGSCCGNLLTNCLCVMGPARKAFEVSTGTTLKMHRNMLASPDTYSCLNQNTSIGKYPICGNGLIEGDEKCECHDYLHPKSCWGGCTSCQTLDPDFKMTGDCSGGTCTHTIVTDPEIVHKKESGTAWWIYLIIVIVVLVVLIIILAICVKVCKGKKKQEPVSNYSGYSHTSRPGSRAPLEPYKYTEPGSNVSGPGSNRA